MDEKGKSVTWPNLIEKDEGAFRYNDGDGPLSDPKKHQLVMTIQNLECLPTAPLPPGYSLRAFRMGDEKAWERIILGAFGRFRSFSEKIATDSHFRPERVLFVCHLEEGPVATACAWHVPYTPEHIGYLYMVGALRAHRGKGLGYAVCLAALNQMVRDKKTSAILVTDSSRLAAIKTYLKLGFGPKPLYPDQLLVWDGILRQLTLGQNQKAQSPIDPVPSR